MRVARDRVVLAASPEGRRARSLVVAAVIVPAFFYLESLFGARTWPMFFVAVDAATARYAVVAAPFLLGWVGRTKVLELLRARRNA